MSQLIDIEDLSFPCVLIDQKTFALIDSNQAAQALTRSSGNNDLWAELIKNHYLHQQQSSGEVYIKSVDKQYRYEIKEKQQHTACYLILLFDIGAYTGDHNTNQPASLLREITNHFNTIDHFENKMTNTFATLASYFKNDHTVLLALKRFDNDIISYVWNATPIEGCKQKIKNRISKNDLKDLLDQIGFSNQGAILQETTETSIHQSIRECTESEHIQIIPVRLETITYGLMILAYHNKPLEPSEEDEALLKNIIDLIANALMRNIIEHEIMENQMKLQDLNATKDKFFSIVAHDLKNPFYAISGFCDILLDDNNNFSIDKRNDILRLMKDSSSSASSLLENLLVWSRAQTGQINCQPQEFAILEIINRVISFFQVNAQNKGIFLINEVPEHLQVYADKNMILTIIQNLVNNAIKFTNHGGQVMIYAQERKKNIIITVSDTGVGIPEKNLSSLFAIDKQFIAQGTSGEKGTGLGLLICNEFVKLNKGKITAESQIDQGTKMHVTLPASKAS